MAERKVTTIPATLNRKISTAPILEKKRRVAGYARVSTDHDEQLSSYEAQVDYYTNYIKSRPEWEFVGIYTDEGISATNTHRREGFKSMIADAKSGKIDLIITKSVSRFARNTVDSLTTVRELKLLGIEIYFEKENIWTLDSKGELLITIMSSLAQEESRSISENVTWGHRKRFADGKAMIPFSSVMGFERGPDGEILVNQEQAEIVRMIFRLFLEGLTPHSIAQTLTKQGIKSPMGKDRWYEHTVRRMLSNEKYKGDALLQKSFTVDFLQKKLKKNEGEIPQYYVEDDHEAIISPEIFDLVQAELERRKQIQGSRYSGVSIFSNKIQCGCCGGWYGSKVWHSNDKYRKVVYQCNEKYKSKRCGTPHITEEGIKNVFVAALNHMIAEKIEIIENLRIMQQMLDDTNNLKEKQGTLKEEIELVVREIDNCIEKNAKKAINQEEYQKQYLNLISRYEELTKDYNEIQHIIEMKKIQSEKINLFIQSLKNINSPIVEFDAVLWSALLDRIVIYSNRQCVFFKDGTTIEVCI